MPPLTNLLLSQGFFCHFAIARLTAALFACSTAMLACSSPPSRRALEDRRLQQKIQPRSVIQEQASQQPDHSAQSMACVGCCLIHPQQSSFPTLSARYHPFCPTPFGHPCCGCALPTDRTDSGPVGQIIPCKCVICFLVPVLRPPAPLIKYTLELPGNCAVLAGGEKV